MFIYFKCISRCVNLIHIYLIYFSLSQPSPLDMLFLEKLSVNPEWKRLQARGMWNIEYNLRIWNCTVSDKWMFKSDRKAAESTDEWKYNKSESLFIVPKREIKVAARAQSRWQNKIRHNLHNDNKSKSSPELIPEIGNYSQSLQTLRPPQKSARCTYPTWAI